MSTAAKPETLLRNAIREALLRIGVRVMTNAQVGRTFHGGLGVGSADLIVCLRPSGRFVGLEVKMPGEKPSPNQVAWGEDIKDNGGAYYIVRSVVEALDAVKHASGETQSANRDRGKVA